MRTAVRCPSPSQGAGGSRQPGGLVPGLSASPGVLSRLRGLCLEHRLQGCSPVPHEGVLAHPRAQREWQGFCSPGKGRPRAGSQGKSQAGVAHSRRRARLLQLKPFPGEQGAELKHPPPQPATAADPARPSGVPAKHWDSPQQSGPGAHPYSNKTPATQEAPRQDCASRDQTGASGPHPDRGLGLLSLPSPAFPAPSRCAGVEQH